MNTQMILGRLLERSEQAAIMLAKIDARVAKLENRKEEIPATELWVKRILTVVAPLATLWLTGSHEKAADVLKMLLAR